MRTLKRRERRKGKWSEIKPGNKEDGGKVFKGRDSTDINIISGSDHCSVLMHTSSSSSRCYPSLTID